MDEDRHRVSVSAQRLRLLAAGTYIAGFACLVVGVLLAFTVSWEVGRTVLLTGALLAGGARLLARWRHLPAP
jgi:hypothetical protein